MVAFAGQIRIMNGQIASMNRAVEGLCDADRMRMIVQQFAREVIPDTQQFVRTAFDEQDIAVEAKFSNMQNEVQRSVRRLEEVGDLVQERVRVQHLATHRH